MFRHACFCGFLSLALAARAQQLPAKSGGDDLEQSANHLLEDLPPLVDEQGKALPVGKTSVEQARNRLQAAQRKSQRWDKLFRQGILSKAEAERCAIEVSTALAALEHANVDEAQSQLEAIQKRVSEGSADKALADSAEASLKSSQEAAAKADAQLLQTKLDLAKINLGRQQLLYNERLVSHSALNAAQAQVQKLTDQQAAKAAAPVP